MRIKFVGRALVITASAALTALTAFAAEVDKTVAQKDGWTSYGKQLGEKVDSVNKKCGSSITANYDKSTYTEFDPLKDRTQAACQAGVDALSAICMTDAGKSAIKNLKNASCRFSTQGTGVSVQGQTLLINIDPAKSSIAGKQSGSYTWSSAIKEIL